jgi:hypothetical protein
MDGHPGKRSPSVRRGWLSVEPLEDRFLLAALSLPVGPYAVRADTSPTSGSTPPPFIGPSVPQSNNPGTTKASQAAAASDGYTTTATTSTAGESDHEYAPAAGSTPPPAAYAASGSVQTVHDHDHDYGDDDDGQNARHYQVVSEAHAAVTSTEGLADDRAVPPSATEVRLESARQPDENSPPPPVRLLPTVANAAPPPKPQTGVVRSDQADTPGGPSAAPAIVPDKHFAQVATAAVSADLPADARPPAGSPSVGDVGVNLHLIERGLESFFARLAGPVEDGNWDSSAAGIASWLAGVAAAALEIARVRDKARRYALSPDGLPSRAATSAGA